MRYHLEVLNDKEFEDLCKELFDTYYKVDFQIFRSGKDGGIDLLYAGKTENEIVVQCKHYVNSNYKLLRDKLLNTELANINKMAPLPKRYVVATSLDLTAGQTKEIRADLSPHIRNSNDIFSRKRIENLISTNPDIEKRFFKLWLTSTSVLLNIIHHGAYNNSEFHKQKIIDRAKLYVPTTNFDQALQKLRENKFLIIAGAPGIGKTTLAYMIICERLAEGFELIYCDGRISEVGHLLSNDPAKKQIFFIDDFLGKNLSDINNPKNSENQLISFIQRFQSGKNKYLVLTSRTTVLSQANHNYEQLRHSSLMQMSKYELEIQEYSLLDKAKILYNHLYFGNVGEKYLDTFYEGKAYKEIITHRNYFPRLIEFITDEKKFRDSSFTSPKDYIWDKLEHPEVIWEHAFENQLDHEERYLLYCLFSLGADGVEEVCLSNAFEQRYKYEIKHNNIPRKPNAYKNALKKVMVGFVNSVQNPATGTNSYSFFNPSITDFLLYYLRGNNIEITTILSSVAYIDQLTLYFDINESKKIKIDESIREEILNNVLLRMDKIGTQVFWCSEHLRKLTVFQSYFEPEMISQQSVPIGLLEKIFSSSGTEDADDLASVLWRIGLHREWHEVIDFVKTNFLKGIALILKNARSEEDLNHLVELFEIYGHDFAEFLQQEENRWLLQDKLGSIFSEMTKDIDHDEQYILTYIDEYGHHSAEERVRQNVWDDYVEFTERLSLGNYFDNLDHEYELDASEIVETIRQNQSPSEDFFPTRITNENTNNAMDSWAEIDRLFSKRP